MTLRFAPVTAALLFLPAYAWAQSTPAPPPPPPPLLDATQASAFAPQGTLLRYQFQPGQFARYRVTTDTLNVLSAGKQDSQIATKQHVETVIRETVRDIRFPDGIATLILQPESLKIVIDGKEVALSAEQRDALLQQREMQMTPTGKIIDAPAGSDQVRRTMDPLIYGFLNAQSAFPPDSVPSGGRWTADWKLTDLGIPVRGVFSLAGIETTRTGSVVRIQAILSGSEQKQQSGNGSAPGPQVAGNSIILFDNTHGDLTKSSVVLHAKLSAPRSMANSNALSNAAVSGRPQLTVDRKLTIERLGDTAAEAAEIQAGVSQTQAP